MAARLALPSKGATGAEKSEIEIGLRVFSFANRTRSVKEGDLERKRAEESAAERSSGLILLRSPSNALSLSALGSAPPVFVTKRVQCSSSRPNFRYFLPFSFPSLTYNYMSTSFRV